MEPEIEAFEITDRDLQDEFNPNRYRGRFTKNKATYGIWAEESDDDHDERPSFGGGRKPPKNYTAPVGFVSGGVKVGDKVTKAQDGDEEEEDDPNKSDSDEEFDRQMFPVDFSEGSRGGGGGRGRGRGQSARSAYAGRRGQRDDDQGIGDWEKHTRGIGQKLLEKMGYIQGKGLGKNQQGISTPVEAAKRKGKAAIGYYGTERTERSLRDFPVKPSAEEEEDETFRQQLHQWKRAEPGKKKKPKYVYKTAEELISTGSATRKTAVPQSQLSKVKVIDMTGREQRVLSGYHAIAHKHDKPDEDEFVAHSRTMEKKAFDMPELLHNLDLLVDMAEEEIIQNDRKLRHEKDMIVNLNHEREKVSAVCEQEEKHIRRMKEVLNIIERCEERSKPDAADPLTLEDCAGLLKMIQDNYYEEYRMYELWVLAVALVFPLMKKEFDSWDPLRRPRHGIGTLRTWRNLLEDSSRQRDAVLDAYQRLIWEIWMPHIRTAVKNWSARHCDSLIEVLEAWTPMVPPWVLDNILEQLVLPRLQTEVEDWNPLTDTMPIHAWLHPWLPLMGNRLEPLYDPIRHKLANALNKWHPSDPSAKMILQPWVDVFSRAKMNGFLLKHILPKLQICMQQFVINPHQQHLDAWTWVTSWLDIMPIPCMVDLLDKHFFPKWLQVLCTWLSNNPNYDEVTKWYRGWKSMFPENLLAEPIMKNHFNKALDIMNRAVSGPYPSMASRDNPAYYQPGARENIAYLTHTERRADVDVRAQEMVRGASASSSIPDTFKEMIERRAEENNLLFMPIPKKTYEAKQVYRVGTVQFYIDRQVVFMLDRTSWVPVSVNALVDRARMESRL